MRVHRLRASNSVRRVLGTSFDDVAAHLCVDSACSACGNRIGDAQANMLVDVSSEAATARLAHRNCGPSQVRDVTALPLSARSSYQYRTLVLPGSVGGEGTSLPTVLVRLAVDVVMLTRAGDRWRVNDLSSLDGFGFAPLTGELPPASDACHADTSDRGITLRLGEDVIDVYGPDLAAAAAVAGAVLVVSRSTGDLVDIGDGTALTSALRHPGTRVALVAAGPVASYPLAAAA